MFFADSALDRVPVRLGKQNAPVRQRNRLDRSRGRIGQRPLQRAHGAKRLAIRGVDLRLGQRAPRGRIGIGRDLLRDVFVQSRVGQQPRLGQVRAVLRESCRRACGTVGALISSSSGSAAGSVSAQRRQPLPRHLRIEEVLIGADNGAIVGRGLRRLVVLRLIEAPAPVERATVSVAPG